MKDLIIIGAGGFGREVQWLIERINENKKEWNLLGYIDDNMDCGTSINGYSVLGGLEYLSNFNDHKGNIVCAVGNSIIRRNLMNRIEMTYNIETPNIIDPSVKLSKHVKLGKGNIVCADSILTVDIDIKDYCILNLDCTVGHDCIFDSFVTVYPSVNISGNVNIGKCVELGTGSHIIQGIDICDNVVVGAGATVIRNIDEKGTYVGSPVKKVK